MSENDQPIAEWERQLLDEQDSMRRTVAGLAYCGFHEHPKLPHVLDLRNDPEIWLAIADRILGSEWWARMVASGQVRTGDGNQSASSRSTTAPVATITAEERRQWRDDVNLLMCDALTPWDTRDHLRHIRRLLDALEATEQRVIELEEDAQWAHYGDDL